MSAESELPAWDNSEVCFSKVNMNVIKLLSISTIKNLTYMFVYTMSDKHFRSLKNTTENGKQESAYIYT